MSGNFLSNFLGPLKLMPSNAGKLDFGISSTGISFWKTTSLGGTAYYFYVTNDGRLLVNTAEPTLGTEGTTVTLTTVDSTTATVPVGTRISDTSGNQYIYMQGVSSLTTTANWVSFDELNVTTLLAAGAKGRVAVAMAVIDASTKFGWFQIYGKNTAAASDAVADNGIPYIDATSGRIDDSAVTGDCVQGAIIRSTDASTNICTVELNYPFVNTKQG